MQSICIGKGTSTNITHNETATINGQNVLHFNNLLSVPKIRKNLISVSQVSLDDNVFFEFYPRYCLVKDIQTKQNLLHEETYSGLDRFNLTKVNQSSNPRKWCNLT